MVGWSLSSPSLLTALLLLFATRGAAQCHLGHLFPDEVIDQTTDICTEGTDKGHPVCQIKCTLDVPGNNKTRPDPKLTCRKSDCKEVTTKSDMCTIDRCKDYDKTNNTCQFAMVCNCDGNRCSSDISLYYAAAKMDRSILQTDNKEALRLGLFRFSIYEDLSTIESPEKYAMRTNKSRSINFNPRIKVNRELFNHLLKMALTLFCFYIVIHFLYRPLNKLVEKGTGKKKKPKAIAKAFSREHVGSIEDDKIEEYLKDESMLFNWYHPQQMFTPIACFPKGFPVEESAITALEEKPVRCNQSKEFLTMTA